MSSETLVAHELGISMLIRPGTRMSDEELVRFSREHRPYRFERKKDGEITMMSPVGGVGSLHEGHVIYALASWTERTGHGVSFPSSVGFNLPDGSCLAPDGAWLSLARWNSLTLSEQEGFPPLCPDFVVEVRSRSDSRHVLEAKMALWMENGAQFAWLVDPVDPSVTIYRQGQGPETLERPEVVEGEGLLAGFVLPAAKLWGTL